MKEDNRLSVDRQFQEKSLQYYSLLRGFAEDGQVSYWIGNPSVQIINGIIKLKPLIRPTGNYQTTDEYLQALRVMNQHQAKQQEVSIKEQYCLLLNGIPNNKGPSELLYDSPFSQYQKEITEVRIIRTAQLRYYAVLLLFSSKTIGRECLRDLLGKEYNQVEIERIILREIQEITLNHNQPQKGKNISLLLKKCSEDLEHYSPDHIFLSAGHPQTIGVKIEEKNTCTICLQEVGGQIISILCGHYFHRYCLERWEFNTCPLCRYYQQPPVITFCQQCNQSDGLWVCLLCGRRLCCGTVNDIMSEDSHIFQHCKQTGHALSMQVQTKFLFDARVPAFLHQMFYRQLVQKGGEQQIPLQDKQTSKKSKMSERISHYQQQVAEQMFKQRAYFQDHIFKVIKDRKNQLNSRKQKLQLKKKQLQNLKLQQQQLLQQINFISTQIVNTQKQQNVISTLIKMKKEKADVFKSKANKKAELQRKRIQQLDALIEQKKQDLLSYKNNITLQQQLKTKLKGEVVGEQICFVHEKNKKKKK